MGNLNMGEKGNEALQRKVQNEEAAIAFYIECSGLCHPNPGGLGVWALTIRNSKRFVIDQLYEEIGYGEGMTNNAAEYIAVLYALDWAVNCASDVPVVIGSSSKLVVNQINDEWECNANNLKPLKDKARELLKHTKAVLQWIPKKENPFADFLTQLAYMLSIKKYERNEK